MESYADALKKIICGECGKRFTCALAKEAYSKAISQCKILEEKEKKESQDHGSNANRALPAKLLEWNDIRMQVLFSFTSPVALN